MPNLKQEMGRVASYFYNDPSKKMTLIGVTGTNGKTSISQFIAQSLSWSNLKCGVIGTLGYGFPEYLLSTTYTTPDAITLQRLLSELQHQGAKAVSMEVSSHALDQNRTSGVCFDIAIFSNLTRDHLDYHHDMDHYAAAKKRLFAYPDLKYAVLNLDDNFGLQLAKEFSNTLEVYGYGINPIPLKIPFINARHINFNGKGTSMKISSPWGEAIAHSRLMGRFNVNNLLAVLTTLNILGVSFKEAINYLEAIETIPGRMQVLGGGKQPLVVVDYAHSPDALQQVLSALREHTHGKLWCIFGCGGDRDRGKRSLMGQIAERFSDQLVITDDNPRTEQPRQIVADIVQGLLCPWAVEIEHDRGAAIAHVISCANPQDVILVAGKGHENYQIIGSEKIFFSDADEIQKHLRHYSLKSR
jgi:UDP-N-acetylmuramoyl-L-alanyl-D-glutamate--2,6-diaminopimelate ligase